MHLSNKCNPHPLSKKERYFLAEASHFVARKIWTNGGRTNKVSATETYPELIQNHPALVPEIHSPAPGP